MDIFKYFKELPLASYTALGFNGLIMMIQEGALRGL